MDLLEIKGYLRLDDTSEDWLIEGLQSTGEKYLENAGIKKDYKNPLYKLAINLLVSHWYENREPTGKADRLAFSLDNIILQLKYCQSGDST